MLLWSFKTVKERQLLWTAFCVLSLLDYKVSSDGTAPSESPPLNISDTEQQTSLPTSTNNSSRNMGHTSTDIPLLYNTISKAQENASTGQPMVDTNKTTSQPVVDTNKTTAVPPTGEPTKKTINETLITSNPKTVIENVTSMHTIVQSSPSQKSTSGTPSNTTTQTMTSAKLWISAPPEQVKSNGSPTTANASDSSKKNSIKCMNIKEVTAHSKVICLELNKTQTCQQFIGMKRDVLEEVLCEKQSCHIKLAESNVNRNCILLVEVNNKGADTFNDVFVNDKSALSKLGIKSHKQESIESHKDYSRKTLIALVTSGLLLAFLGLAGYHFMKRRSWSPMGERLGEDPYYTENDSHGNPVSSHEHSDLQDKPNINGGARENGTGQASSKNGQSARPHIADTEL